VGVRYQKARDDRTDLFITLMEVDHPVVIAEKFERPQFLTDITNDPNPHQCYDQLVAWMTQQYDLATYLQAVDSCLASTTCTQGDSPFPGFALIDSPLDELR